MVKNLIPWRKRSEELTPSRGNGHPLEVLQRQINEIFEDFFEGFGKSDRWPSLRRSSRVWPEVSPRFEVSETDKEVRVKAELPGFEEKDIEVILDENVLTIRGEKKEEHEEKKRNYYLSELSYGRFQRSIPLPSGVDRERAKASFKRGVLTVRMPKTESAQAQRKRIAISAE